MRRDWSGIGRSKTSPLYRLFFDVLTEFSGEATTKIYSLCIRYFLEGMGGGGERVRYSLIMYPKSLDVNMGVRVITPAYS